MRVRCPKCNRYGSSKLNGYCRACAPDTADLEDREHIVKDTYFETNGFRQGKFVPDGYGIVKSKYGYQKGK